MKIASFVVGALAVISAGLGIEQVANRSDGEATPEPLTSTTTVVGNEGTIAGNEDSLVMPLQVAGRPYGSLAELTEDASLVVVGRISDVQPAVKEVIVSQDQEGVAPGEGPDIYGTITMVPTDVLKGDPNLKEVKIGMLTGKRSPTPQNPNMRITYSSELLSDVQLPNGTFVSSKALEGKRFIAFLNSNDGYIPLGRDVMVLHPVGLGLATPSGGFKFHDKPAVNSTETPNLDELRKAVVAR